MTHRNQSDSMAGKAIDSLWVESEAVSLVITGQIKSRLEIVGGAPKVVRNLEQFKKLNEENEVVISTFEEEFDSGIFNAADRVVISKDPGPDEFKVHRWPIGDKSKRNNTNYSRIFTTAIAGISVTKNQLIIKTRIELIPDEFGEFIKWLEFCAGGLDENSKRIAVFSEHYQGIHFSIDGTLPTLPGTLLAGEKDNLLEVYKRAKVMWDKNYKVFTRNTLLFPVVDEQILGIAFLQMNCGFNLEDNTRRVKRYFVSFKLIKSILICEREYLIYTSYRDSGFSKNYFKGTSHIKVPQNFGRNGAFYTIPLLVLVIAKRFVHIQRRVIRGIKRELAH